MSAALKTIISDFEAAREAWEVADPEADCDGPEWDAYAAAERVLVKWPCQTLDEVQQKAAYFLGDAGLLDTVQNCHTGDEESLRVFLRSLTQTEGGAS